MNYFCDKCKCRNTHTNKYHHSVTVKGKKLEFDKERRFCDNCNSLVYDEELDNESIKEAFRIYNEKYGISKEEIKKIRKDLNLSLDDFAKIIGCAKKTLISYENGTSIPNDIYLVTIKTIIDNPDVIRNFIEANKERYSDKEYDKINSRISKKISNNYNNLFYNVDKDLSEFNGYSKFSFKKIISLIQNLSKTGINKTKLLKEMFYVDFLTYKKYMYSLTGLEYVKLPYGPVPDDYEIILNKLEQDGYIDYNINYYDNYEECIIKNKAVINNDIFLENELEIINYVTNKFKDYKVSKIVEYSHEEEAFIKTNYKDKISYTYALDLKITDFNN